MKVPANKAKSFVGQECTLDGRPARITGRKQPFATVVTTDKAQKLYDGYGNVVSETVERAVVFSWLAGWQAVRSVMTTRNGAFSS